MDSTRPTASASVTQRERRHRSDTSSSSFSSSSSSVAISSQRLQKQTTALAPNAGITRRRRRHKRLGGQSHPRHGHGHGHEPEDRGSRTVPLSPFISAPSLSSCIPQSPALDSSVHQQHLAVDDMARKHRPARPRFWLAGPDEDIESVYPAPGGVGQHGEFASGLGEIEGGCPWGDSGPRPAACVT